MPEEVASPSVRGPDSPVKFRMKVVATVILLVVNLLNYVDRYTIVGVITDLKIFFNMDDKDSGLLQTVFIGFYMIFAPLFGYLGDRYNRKFLMMFGIVVWIVAVFASSFVPEGHYFMFLALRGVVGIGEASYSTIAPTILSDLFSGAARSRVFMIFYFAVPFGSGLGFIIGSHIGLYTGSWQWGVRFSPFIGIICLIVMFFLLEEPVRGACEGARQQAATGSVIEDIKYLASVKTYSTVCLGSVAMFFAVGTTSWWTPPFIGYAYAKIHHVKKAPEAELAHINLIFGIITCVSGLLGVLMGSLISRAWKDGKGPFRNHASDKADAYISAFAMFISLPFLFLAILFAKYNINITLGLLFFAILGMCLNFAIIVDIIMYVVVANRRATALAVQTLVAHLFGDASSPYIIGVISDFLRGNDASSFGHFYSLQRALYIPTFMLIASGAFFLMATFYVEYDRKEALFQMDARDEYDGPSRAHEDMNSLVDGRGDTPDVDSPEPTAPSQI